jgi:hypothetical protein
MKILRVQELRSSRKSPLYHQAEIRPVFAHCLPRNAGSRRKIGLQQTGPATEMRSLFLMGRDRNGG